MKCSNGLTTAPPPRRCYSSGRFDDLEKDFAVVVGGQDDRPSGVPFADFGCRFFWFFLLFFFFEIRFSAGDDEERNTLQTICVVCSLSQSRERENTLDTLSIRSVFALCSGGNVDEKSRGESEELKCVSLSPSLLPPSLLFAAASASASASTK